MRNQDLVRKSSARNRIFVANILGLVFVNMKPTAVTCLQDQGLFLLRLI